MKVIFISVLLLVSITCLAQYKTVYPGKIDIHINGVTLLDDMSRYRIGAEYSSNNRVGYLLDVGFKSGFNTEKTFTKFYGIVRNWGTNYNVFEIRPEIKWYFEPKNEVQTKYVSAELFYINSSYQIKGYYYRDRSLRTDIFYSKADFRRQKTGIHLKYGSRLLVQGPLLFDFYVGAGIAYRMVQPLNVIDPVDDHGMGGTYINNTYVIKGNYLVFHSTAGFKICYTL